MIDKAKELFKEYAFTSHEGTHHAVDYDDFMLIIEELAKDIPKSFDECLAEECKNPSPMLCPECQEVQCDEDCSNPREQTNERELIKHIKTRIAEIEQNAKTPNDLMFDVMNFLKTLDELKKS